MATYAGQLNDELAALVGRAEESLVQVRNGESGAGAGTIWHRDGLVITNAHVVRRQPFTVVFSDRRTSFARLIAYDADADLGALVVPDGGLPTMRLGDSRNLKVGEWVLALGHPGGVRGSLTAGVVIGVGPDLPGERRSKRDWVIVDLHLRPGYSGGPLLDFDGRLVGVNTMMIGADVGVAVPLHVVKSFLKERLGSSSL